MPSIIDQIRQQQAWEQPKKASLWPLIAGALAAFLAGGGGVYAWSKFKAASTASTTAAAPQAERNFVSLAEDKPRIGQANAAPLLKICVQRGKTGALGNGMIDNAMLYKLLQQGGQMTQFAAVTGMKGKAAAENPFTILWADVADCIYRQNGWMLCDPDNRAFAIEAVVTLSRQIASAVSQPGRSELQYGLSNARAVQDRVLATLRTRVEEGRLIAADFGMFTPGDVRRVVDGAVPKENACAKRS